MNASIENPDQSRRFYTYLHCLPDGTPFYVGKGCDQTGHGRRSHTFGTGRHKTHKEIVERYGRKNIKIYIFECDSEEEALADEIQQIAGLRRDGYELVNITKGGRGTIGHRHSPETRAKLAAANMGNTYGLGNQNRLGKPHTDQTKNKMSIKRVGRTPMLGKKHTPESRAKISAALKGNTYAKGNKWQRISPSMETRAKISASLLGKPWSAERRADHNKRKLSK